MNFLNFYAEISTNSDFHKFRNAEVQNGHKTTLVCVNFSELFADISRILDFQKSTNIEVQNGHKSTLVEEV